MDSQCVRYLFFLVLLVVCAQIVEIYATAELSGGGTINRGAAAPFEFTTWAFGVFYTFAPWIGPFVLLALAGLILFRTGWSLWCLTLCANGYAAFVLLGMLLEYGTAREALAVAARGSRYMNCAGDARFVFFLLAFPLTAGTLLVCAVVHGVETGIRTGFDVPADALP